MYGISALSKPSIQWVGIVTSSGVNRKPVFALAIAHCLSRQLPLPIEAVADIRTYYRLQHEITMIGKLSSLNELFPFDTKAAKEAILSFYCQRYRAANPPAIPLALQKDTALEDFFGLTTYFSNDVLCLIREQGELLTQTINGLTMLLSDMDAAYKRNMIGQQAVEQDRFVA